MSLIPTLPSLALPPNGDLDDTGSFPRVHHHLKSSTHCLLNYPGPRYPACIRSYPHQLPPIHQRVDVHMVVREYSHGAIELQTVGFTHEESNKVSLLNSAQIRFTVRMKVSHRRAAVENRTREPLLRRNSPQGPLFTLPSDSGS